MTDVKDKLPGDKESLVKMKPDKVPSYLLGAASLCHTNVVIICEDGIQLKTSRVTLAANSKLMKQVLSSMGCCEDSSPACCDDHIQIYAESHSSNVLQVLRFMHHGCLYSSAQDPAALPLDTIQAFNQFGLDVVNVKFTTTVAEDLFPSNEFIAEPRKEIKPDMNLNGEHDFAQEIKVEDDFFKGYVEKIEEEEEEEDFVPDDNDSDYEPAAKYPKCIIEDTSLEVNSKAFHFPQQGEVDLTAEYECSKCVRKFHVESDLKQHLRRHEDNKAVFTCFSCDKVSDKVTFSDKIQFEEHLRICDPLFKFASTEKKDLYFHFPQTREDDKTFDFHCQLCTRGFKSQSSFEQHLRRHVSSFTPKETFSCLKCNKVTFEKSVGHSRHQKTCRVTTAKLPKHIQAVYDQHDLVVKQSTKARTKQITRPRGRPRGTKKDLSEKLHLPVADTLFYFPQAGEIDLTKRYQCSKCIRKFELEHDWQQHVRRHDSKSDAELFFCLKCDDRVFEHEKDYIEHKKSCEEDFEYKTVIGGDPHSQEKYYFHFPQTEEENELYPFKCKLCIRTFQMRKQFEQHIRRHVNNQTLDEAYTCLTCNQMTFPNYKDWKDHETKCEEKDTQLPEHVWKVYELHGLFDPVEKRARKDPKTQYCCAPCSKVFNGKYKYRMHLEQMGPYHETCGSCNFKITNMSEYQKHVDAAHSGVMMYRCSKCGESFSNVILVKHHKSKKHKGQKVNEKLKDFLRICEVCGKELKSPSGMYNHMMMFHGGKLLDCAQCGGTYRSEAHLKAHIKREHEKSYQCDQCGFSTKKSRAYEVHVLKEHTPNAERPFKCHYCPKGFFDRRVYEDHLNIHTGARPYACPHCNATFNSKGNYGAHIRQTHKGIKRKK